MRSLVLAGAVAASILTLACQGSPQANSTAVEPATPTPESQPEAKADTKTEADPKADPEPLAMTNTGILSEQEFAALHELTDTKAPPPKGIEIELAGAKAYLSLPEGAKAPLPGVVVIHEWWGLRDNRRPGAA